MPRPRFFRAIRQPDRSFVTDGELECLVGQQIPSVVSDAPDGVWAEWRWDGSELVVRTDRFGFMPVFYWSDKDSITVSTSLIDLVARGAPTEIDPVAISVFLQVGYYIDDTTPFRSIRVAPPNGTIRWNGELAVIDDRPMRGVTPDVTHEQAIDGYIELFQRAISRRRPKDDRFAVPLSGGRDSRHILLELLRQGHTPALVVTSEFPPPKSSPEVEPARKVCEALGLEHALAIPPSHFEQEYRQNLLQHCGADEGGWMIGMADMLHQRVHTSYDGVAGDMYGPARVFSRQWLEAYGRGRVDDIAESMLGRSVEPLARMLGSDYAGVGDREAAFDALKRELLRYQNNANPFGEFTTFNRARREVGQQAYSILSGLETVHSPYLDHELNDFLAQIPWPTMWEGDLHTEVVHRAYPEHAHLPFAGKMKSISAGGMYAKFAMDVLAYARRRNPDWLRRIPRLAAHWTKAAGSRRYRSSVKWATPARILNLILVDELRKNPARLAADYANEP